VHQAPTGGGLVCVGFGLGLGDGVLVAVGDGDGDGPPEPEPARGVNHVEHQPFRSFLETRTVTCTRYPGVAPLVQYQTVRRP